MHERVPCQPSVSAAIKIEAVAHESVGNPRGPVCRVSSLGSHKEVEVLSRGVVFISFKGQFILLSLFKGGSYSHIDFSRSSCSLLILKRQLRSFFL